MMCFSCILQLKYKEVYEKSKAQINMDPEAHEIRAAKEAYKNISNVSVISSVKLIVLIRNSSCLDRKKLENLDKIFFSPPILAQLQEEV